MDRIKKKKKKMCGVCFTIYIKLSEQLSLKKVAD